jgi:DNA-directed RNA polymerase subunit RPC12/RpoP
MTEKEKEPVYVCWDCGTPFLTENQKKRDGAITAHTAECDLCHEVKVVTHIRHWNYLQPQNNNL